MSDLVVQRYGTTGPTVVLLHGGPGAPGHMAPIARELATTFRVLEPYQRRSGSEPLTIDCHIEDLHQLLASFPHSVGLVGASWGAMLALAYAASHWERADPLVLIGCGTFNEHSRAQMHQTLAERMTPELRAQIKQTDLDILSPDERLENLAHLLLPVYSVELITSTLESAGCDAVGHQESWADMMEHQKTGRYPQAFSSISAPVLMLHGSADPHPGMMIRDSLKPWLPHLEYHEWEQCGHYPWLERAVKKDFYHTLTSWLHQHLPTASH